MPEILQSVIYLISTSLLYPVIIILIALTLWLITEIGVFSFEWFTKTKKKPKDLEIGIIEAKDLVDKGKFTDGIKLLGDYTSKRFVYIFLDNLLALKKKEKQITQDNPGIYIHLFSINLEKLLQKCDILISKRLEKTRTMIRLGPMLGLMGTLIPMGPALLALTKGDVHTLAGNLIIAFGTTVIGLMIGGVSYLITVIRTRWYKQDMNDINYICEVLFTGDK